LKVVYKYDNIARRYHHIRYLLVILLLAEVFAAQAVETVVVVSTDPAIAAQAAGNQEQAVATEPAVSPDRSTITDYKFGAGDRIKIQVLGEPDLTIETLVSDIGSISYPFIGMIKVRDMTAAGLEEFITQKLKGPYLVNPIVTVSLLQYRNFYINGWVKTPGGYPFQPGMTVRKAIALAGGFNERADRRNIVVIPSKSPGLIPIPTKLSDPVNPGDVITVKRSFF